MPRKTSLLSSVCPTALALTLLFSMSSQADPAAWPSRELIQGTPISSTNGIAVGPNGNLYIATAFHQEIAVVDPRTGHVLNRLGPEAGIGTPDDLAFGPDGSLYWTSPFTGEVGRIRPDGSTQIIAHVPLGINPIAFDDQGRLFAATTIFDDQLFELDPDGVLPPRLILQGLGNLNGFAFGKDGLLYAPLTFAGSVIRIDVDAKTVETVATGFVSVPAVVVDPQGDLIISESATGRLIRLDTDGNELETIAVLATGTDNLEITDDGTVYATSLIDGSITEVDNKNRVRTIHAAGMTLPGGLAVTPDGGQGDRLWVGDFFSLRSFSSWSGRPQSVKRTLPGNTLVIFPNTVSAYGDNLVLSTWMGNAVQIYDPENDAVLLTIRDMAMPLNAIAFGDDLIVSERFTGSVVRVSIADPSQRQALATGLLVPSGLAATADALWATDQAAGAILEIVFAGQVLAPPRVVASGLMQPEGLAVLPSGDLVVVEAGNGRVSQVEPASGQLTTIAEDLALGKPGIGPFAPSTWRFNGVAVGSDGAIYVTGEANNVVYKLWPEGNE